MTEYEQAAQTYLTAKEQLVTAIIAARQQGTSWTEIGRPLGISKQAAQQKFGGMVTLASAGRLPGPSEPVAVSHRSRATTDAYLL